jgi:hypothetical protein
MTKKNIANETMDTAMELTQKSANLVLKGAVQSAEVAENYVQGMYKVGYEANVEALKTAKNYWDTASQIRQDWLKLFANVGENFINSAAKMELPLQKEVTDVARNIIANVEESVENLTKQAKTATK